MLVSQGAHAFATSNGIPTCDAAALVSPRCVEEWEHWKKVLADVQSSTPPTDLRAEMPMQDTVGAICWDSNGKLAAGVSRFGIALVCSRTHSAYSGGLLLKYPGRIGEVRKRNIISDGLLTHERPQYLELDAGHSRIPKSVSGSLAASQVSCTTRRPRGPP
jgi:isoaspartyl peptidase/L-asparaginase-like protein (Ntn-hydrolase superfamily)